MPAPDYATEIASLDAALAAGELTVESDGDRVTYHSFDEIRKRRDHFSRLAATASGRPAASGFGFSAAAFERD